MLSVAGCCIPSVVDLFGYSHQQLKLMILHRLVHFEHNFVVYFVAHIVVRCNMVDCHSFDNHQHIVGHTFVEDTVVVAAAVDINTSFVTVAVAGFVHDKEYFLDQIISVDYNIF